MSKKILIVDDEPAMVEILKDTLEERGFMVITGSNGIEAVKKIEEENPDLVLLDIMMPGMNGYEVCKKVKGKPDTKFLIVVLSAISEPDSISKAKELGADEYLTKPYKPEQLMATIDKLLKE